MKTASENDVTHGYFHGNLGIDPFHLYPADQADQRRLQFTEIMMGRVSMLAAAVFLAIRGLTWMGFEKVELLSMLSTFSQTG
jgi:hypothetical protein